MQVLCRGGVLTVSKFIDTDGLVKTRISLGESGGAGLVKIEDIIGVTAIGVSMLTASNASAVRSLNGSAPADHTHPTSQITNLDTTLATKLNKANFSAIEPINVSITTTTLEIANKVNAILAALKL